MTKITISPKRKTEIKQLVLNTLLHGEFSYLPIDIKKICKSFEFIRLIPYSVQMRHRNMTYLEVCTQCESEDACADFYASKGKYIIYYNDVVKWKYITSNRYRWSIAHELGHILLLHHINYKKTRIFRSNLSSYEYNYLEAEADYFAQLILVPHVVLYHFKVRNETQIKYLCKISGVAANNRLREYKTWVKNINRSDSYDSALYRYYYVFIFQKYCRTCGAHLIQSKGKYCPICGSKNTLQWGDGKMNYRNWEVDENGRVKTCIRCGNENLIGAFCHICGSPVENRCTDYLYNDYSESCSNSNLLPPNARYCHICGSESLFKQRNMLCTWQEELRKVEEQEQLDAQNSFMNIPDNDDELPFTQSTNYFPIPEGIDEELPFN